MRRAPRREPPSRLGAVLFDLDGTLIDTRRLYLECYRRALAPQVGRELSDEELLAARPRSETFLLRSQLPEERLAACLADLYRHYEELHASHFQGIYPGVPELLEGLRAAGHSLGIVTGKSRRAWEITAARAPLGAFDVLVFDDDMTAPKPDPGGLLLALRRLDVAPEDAVYVGDTASDLEAAVAAGMVPMAVLWSRPGPERARFAAQADALGARAFQRVEELARALAAHPPAGRRRRRPQPSTQQERSP
jgi:HAD superfamily hydrolase (TIGR01509 family)